jgi:hypothetical protein
MPEPEYSTSGLMLALDDRRHALAILTEANAALDAKLGGLLSASGVLVALVSVVVSGESIGGNGQHGASVLVGIMVLSMILFSILVTVVLRASRPVSQDAPGSNDWSKINEAVVLATSGDAYLYLLSNVIKAINLHQTANTDKAVRVRVASVLLVVEVVMLTLGAIVVILS